MGGGETWAPRPDGTRPLTPLLPAPAFSHGEARAGERGTEGEGGGS